MPRVTLPPVPAGLPKGVITYHSDGTVTVQTVKTPVRNEDGTIRATHHDGTITTYATTEEFRSATGWRGVVPSQANLDFRQQIAESMPRAQWVRGASETAPHPLLAGYLAAVDALDIDTAGREVEQFEIKQGYAQYEGIWTTTAVGTLVIVEMIRDVKSKGGRLLVKGDVALGYLHDDVPDAEVTVFSARRQVATLCSRTQVRVLATKE